MDEGKEKAGEDENVYKSFSHEILVFICQSKDEHIEKIEQDKLELSSEVSFLNFKVQERDKKIEELNARLEKHLAGIKAERNETDPDHLKGIDLTGYNFSWAWTRKVRFVLEKAEQPLRKCDFVALLKPIEEAVQKSSDPISFFSSPVRREIKNSHVIGYKAVGYNCAFYGLPEWTDSSGEFKGDYYEKMQTVLKKYYGFRA